MLGIIERTGQISVDNALQYVSDVKEDIDLYEEVSDEEEPQDVQDFYKRNRTALNNELEEIQEKYRRHWNRQKCMKTSGKRYKSRQNFVKVRQSKKRTVQ